MLMSRRYWSSDPSSYDDFRCVVTPIRAPAPRCDLAARGTRGIADDDSGPSVNAFSKAPPPDVGEPRNSMRWLTRIAVIHDERLAFHQGVWHEAPIAAVVRVVPVVAQHEIALLRDDQRTPVVTRWMIRRATRGSLFYEVISLPFEVFTRRVFTGRSVVDVLLIECTTVEPHDAFTHLQRVAREADQTLDEILGRVLRPLEDDDVAALRTGDGRKVRARERNLGAVDGLVHEQEVSDQQRPLHAPRRDLERLDEKGPDQEKEDDGDDEGLGPVDEHP